METGVQIYIFFWIYIVLFTGLFYADESICGKHKTYNIHGLVVNFRNAVCCDNYEMREHKCVECRLGYYRPFDHKTEKCIPCKDDAYGKKCAFLCNCHSNERCNSITGCVLKHSTNKEHTTEFQKSYVYETIKELKDSSNNEPTEASSIKEFTDRERSPNAFEDREMDRERSDVTKTYKSFFNYMKMFICYRQTIIYIMIGGTFMVLLISCNISCLYAIYIKSKSMSVIGGSVPLTSQPSSLSQVPTESNDTVVRINVLDHNYEEIDELDIIVNARQDIDNTSDESDADSKSVSTISPTEDDEGYLHPYHSLLHSEMKGNFVLDEHHNATNLRSNDPLSNSQLSSNTEIQNKTPIINGFKSRDSQGHENESSYCTHPKR